MAKTKGKSAASKQNEVSVDVSSQLKATGGAPSKKDKSVMVLFGAEFVVASYRRDLGCGSPDGWYDQNDQPVEFDSTTPWAYIV